MNRGEQGRFFFTDVQGIQWVDLGGMVARPQLSEQRAHALQLKVVKDVFKNRGMRGVKQYGVFFASMYVYGLLQPAQAELIRSSYFWFRHLDDIADRDKPLPMAYPSQHAYLEEKKALVQRLGRFDRFPVIGEEEDILLVHYLQKAKELGIDLTKESQAIIDTMIFDVQRGQERRILTKEELDAYFDKLDLACVGGGLKVAGETYPPETLWSLSMAVRTMFNLRDFPKDLREGLVNISREDIASYGIDLAECKGATVEELLAYQPLREWYQSQVLNGFDHLANVQATMATLFLKPITHIALSFNFERVAANGLSHINKLLTSV